MTQDSTTSDRPDLLLIYPPYDVKFYQPVGLAQLAGFLRVEGYKVKIMDAVTLEHDFEQVCSFISEYNPRIIGVSIPFSEMANNGVEMLKICRERFAENLLICGGYHCWICPEDVIDYCDLVVISEGEETTQEIISKYNSGQYLFDIKGTAFKVGNEAVINPARELLQDVNLPFPAWDLLPIEHYNMTLYLSTGEVAFPLQTGYGCPFACTFCCNSKLHEKVRYKDIKHVLDEINWIVQRFGVRGFHIWDETFTLNRSRVEEFCVNVIDRKMDIHWSAQTRVGLLDRELLELMKRAGCVRISIGVESGDPAILESINKKIDLKEAVRAIDLARDVGVISYAGFMIGHADDNPETVSHTISFANELNPDFVGFRCAIPYPGSVFRDNAERNGGIITYDLSKYRDDTIVYRPPGLSDYDLNEIRRLAYSYFYWQNMERISRVLLRGFQAMFEDTLEIGPAIYLSRKNDTQLLERELLEKHCRSAVTRNN